MVDPADPPLAPESEWANDIEFGIVAGAAYWGADPDTIVRGVVIVLREHPVLERDRLELASGSAEFRMIYLSDGYSPTGRDRPGCAERARRPAGERE
jgi:hypothetical protein